MCIVLDLPLVCILKYTVHSLLTAVYLKEDLFHSDLVDEILLLQVNLNPSEGVAFQRTEQGFHVPVFDAVNRVGASALVTGVDAVQVVDARLGGR